MKRFLLINASPRVKGTSAMLTQDMREYLMIKGHDVSLINLYPNLSKMDAIVEAFAKADTLVVIGPCYINTYPADTYALLETLSQHPDAWHGQLVYGVIQGGMPYAHTHRSGLSTLRLFSKACGLRYSGGFVMGMGAMLNGQPFDKLLNAKVVKGQWRIFLAHVDKGEESPDQVYEKAQLRLPGFVWRLMARWVNGTIDRDLKARHIDQHQASPYL